MRPEADASGVNDWSLLERIQQKDEAALSALYDRYSGLVYSEAKRILRDTGAAEEILQDLFYQVWRTAERFDAARGSLAGWLVVAARNRAISKLRKKSGKTEELVENTVFLGPSLESSTTQNLMLDKVKAVLGNLPDSQREAMEFAYFEGMSHSEIAERTGQPLGTIKTRIRSGMEALKKVLS
ncbi:MAG: sigma-70 family RNA polymerase sigma factor [Candidatus Acidiferrum sp.]